MANEAIGILFEVKGGGSIEGASGKRINGQLRHIVGEMAHKTDTLKLKFDVDTSHLQKELKNIKADVDKTTKAAGKVADSVPGGAKGQISEYSKAKKIITEYYRMVARIQKIASRTTEVSIFGDDEKAVVRMSKAHKKLEEQFKSSKAAYASLKDSLGDLGLEDFEAEKKLQNQVNAENITSSAENAWANLTAKVHDYIDRVEYAASRDKAAADGLKKLREMANSTDYRGYDELKKKLAEVNHYINKNNLDTETWGQKMIKTFGSRVRSALAGIVTAKIGQYIRDIYNNVVELDKALVDLQIATGKTREETKKLIKEYAALGKEIGATTLEVAKSADTWLRQGYLAEQSTTLIKNSMMLSKLGQIESADASTYLTSAMKGYKLEVEDSIGVVDKLTAVDMEAAASAGDIATAMAETAASAELSGVQMDTLIGYIASVKEVTQDGAESVGTFYKTLFARMNNVAAGKFVDEETGESLNDVETVLNELGITLRNTNGTFRESSKVLDDIALRWSSFDNVQQHAIATAMAGTRQQEKFIVLMENYGNAQKYAEVSTNSAGTAMEKYQDYLNGVEGKMNSLKASFEQLSVTILNSELVKGFLDIGSALVSFLSFGDGFVTKIAIVTAALIALTSVTKALTASVAKQYAAMSGGVKNFVTYISYVKNMAAANGQAKATIDATTAAAVKQYTTGLMGIVTAIPRFIAGMTMWVVSQISAKKATDAATASTLTFKAAMDAVSLNWTTLAITGAIAAIVGICVAFDKASDAAKNYNAQQQQIINATYETTANLKAEREELDELISSYYELAEANQGVYDASEREKILEIQEKINEIIDDETKKVNLLDASYENLKETMQSLHSAQVSSVERSIEMESKSIETLMNMTKNAYAFESGGSLKVNKDKLGVFGTLDYGKDIYEFRENLKKEIEHLDSWKDSSNFTFLDKLIEYTPRKNYAEEMLADVEDSISSIEYHMQEISELQIELSHAKFLEGGGGGANGIVDTVQEYVDLKEALASALEESEDFSGTQDDINSSVERFVQSEYPEIYNEIATNVTHANYQMKEFSDLVDSVTGGLDALKAATDEMSSSGALSLDTVSKLKEFGLDDYLERTENGFYKLTGSIEEFQKKRQDELIKIMKSNEYSLKDGVGNDAYENAKAELEDLLAIFNTYGLESEIEEATDRLEGQLEKFEEMIDLRKELLQTYKKERDYQKELQKKQDTVASLRTKLEVSRLDTSAAGVAKTKELESELQEAEDDLEDFTLEHAIEILSTELDNQKQEYKQLIQSEINGLKDAITTSAASIETVLERFVDANNEANANNAINKLQSWISDHGITSYDDLKARGGEGLYNAAKSAYESSKDSNGNNKVWQDSLIGWHTPPKQAKSNPYHYYSNVSLDTESGPDDGKIGDAQGDNFVLKIGDNARYKLQLNTADGPANSSLANSAVTDSGGALSAGNVIRNADSGQYYVRAGSGKWYEITGRGGKKTTDYKAFIDSLPKYHTGGFVGDVSTLSAGEEFAKLLKGEFVSTPSQMKRFIETTLPSVANYASTSGGNEFNAPLIEIKCDSVTSESMPKLKSVVDEAVKEVRKALEGGMKRTGYKRRVNTI